MKLYNVKCSLSGSCDDVHAIFDWSVHCATPQEASDLATEAWRWSLHRLQGVGN